MTKARLERVDMGCGERWVDLELQSQDLGKNGNGNTTDNGKEGKDVIIALVFPLHVLFPDF